MKGMQAYKAAIVIAREFHAQLIANLKVEWSLSTEQEHKMVDGPGGGEEIMHIVVIFFILSPEIIQIIPKHIGYNYYDHTIIRTTPAQNPTIALSVMQIKGSHLGFYIDFVLISWLVFKTGGRNKFLTTKYPKIEVLFMIVAPEDQFLHWDPFSVFAHLHHSFNMLNNKNPKSWWSGN